MFLYISQYPPFVRQSSEGFDPISKHGEEQDMRLILQASLFRQELLQPRLKPTKDPCLKVFYMRDLLNGIWRKWR